MRASLRLALLAAATAALWAPAPVRADERTPARRAMDEFHGLRSTVERFQDAVHAARESRPTDAAKYAAASRLRTVALLGFRRASRDIDAAAKAGLDHGGLGEETAKSLREMVGMERDVFRESANALPPAPPPPPPPPLPENPPSGEEIAEVLPFLPTLESIEKVLGESIAEFIGRYGYYGMNPTTIRAGEAAGVADVASASNEWGYKAEAAVDSTKNARSRVAGFIRWVKEGRTTGVLPILYAYRVMEFFSRWLVRRQVLEDTMEEFVDACVQLHRERRAGQETAIRKAEALHYALLARAVVTIPDDLPGFDPEGKDLPRPVAEDVRETAAPPTASPEIRAVWDRVTAARLETDRLHEAAERLVYTLGRELHEALREKRATAPTTRLRFRDAVHRRVEIEIGEWDLRDSQTAVWRADTSQRLSRVLPGGAERLRKEAERVPVGSFREDLLREAEKLEQAAPKEKTEATSALEEARSHLAGYESWLRAYTAAGR